MIWGDIPSSVFVLLPVFNWHKQVFASKNRTLFLSYTLHLVCNTASQISKYLAEAYF